MRKKFLKMKKRDFLNEINETLAVFGKTSSLDEAVNFAESYDGEYDGLGGEDSEEEPEDEVEKTETMENEKNTEEVPFSDKDTEGLEEMGSEVDRIREIALRGMVKLCHNTENPAYDALKKIFQFCDKVNEKKEEPVK